MIQLCSTIRVLQGATAHTAATTQPGTPGEPLLFSISAALWFFTCATQHMGQTALRPIRSTKQWLSVLLKATSVTAGDSNPHSADPKHQFYVIFEHNHVFF